MSGDVVSRARELLDGTEAAPLTIHLASADEIIGALTELVAEAERLRGLIETIRTRASEYYGPSAANTEGRRYALADILAVIERAGIEP